MIQEVNDLGHGVKMMSVERGDGENQHQNLAVEGLHRA